jgi:hypothetical protein
MANNMQLKTIRNMKIWKTDADMLEYCEHILKHTERYIPERVFEAKNILQWC